MYQSTTMNKTLIYEDTPVSKKKIALTVSAVVFLLCLAAVFFVNPKIFLVGLAGFCVLAALTYHAAFLTALFRPAPKAQN